MLSHAPEKREPPRYRRAQPSERSQETVRVLLEKGVMAILATRPTFAQARLQIGRFLQEHGPDRYQARQHAFRIARAYYPTDEEGAPLEGEHELRLLMREADFRQHFLLYGAELLEEGRRRRKRRQLAEAEEAAAALEAQLERMEAESDEARELMAQLREASAQSLLHLETVEQEEEEEEDEAEPAWGEREQLVEAFAQQLTMEIVQRLQQSELIDLGEVRTSVEEVAPDAPSSAVDDFLAQVQALEDNLALDNAVKRRDWADAEESVRLAMHEALDLNLRDYLVDK